MWCKNVTNNQARAQFTFSNSFVIHWVIIAIFLCHSLNMIIFIMESVVSTWIYCFSWTEPAIHIIALIIHFDCNSGNEEKNQTFNDDSKIMLGAETWTVVFIICLQEFSE